MRLGPNEDVEWLKRGFTTVEDNYEDGLPFVPIFSPVSAVILHSSPCLIIQTAMLPYVHGLILMAMDFLMQVKALYPWL